MSHSDSEEIPLMPRGPAQARLGTKGQVQRSGRRGYAAMVGQEGPATLAVVVGQRQGRWAREINAARGPAREARRLLQEAGLDLECDSPDRVVGLAAVVGWRCVASEVGHVQSLALIEASLDHHLRRKVQRFLEHRVLASTEITVEVPLPSGWQHMPAKASCRHVLDAARASDVLAKDRFGQQVSVEQILSDWARTLGVKVSEGLLWPVFTPIAVGMVQRSWFGDVSRWSPVANGRLDMAPRRPSVGLLRYFGRLPVHYELPAGQPQDSESAIVWASSRGFVKGYTPDHLIRCVRASRKVSDKGQAKQCLEDSLRFFYPNTWQSVMATTEVHVEAMASHWTIQRATVRMDQAAMLWNRSIARSRGPLARYIAFDASPQHGQDIFVTVERVVERAALGSLCQLDRPVVDIRTMPVSILGTGRMGLAEKTQAHIHQTWLDYGPAARDVREACASVLSILSDMGTEFGIGDALDVIDQSLGHDASSQGQQRDSALPAIVDETKYLYPNAIVVPGPQHIIDNALHTSLEGQVWWPAFQVSLKAVAQWLHPVTNRRFLRSKLPAEDSLRPAFEKGCDRFATWRWKTLAKVTGDLKRLETAVRSALPSVGPADELASRTGQLGVFLATSKDPAFWERVRWAHRLLGPLTSFAAWIRGCDCHEAERLQNKVVVCQWQGCRASALGQRLETAFAELRDLRAEMRADSPDADIVLARMLHTLKLKMAWVNEEPALVWQAWDPAKASEIIRQRDELVSLGQQPHRVTELFAAPGQPLRRDLEKHAAGEGMSGALRAELLAYSLAKIDDTWAEASHRDVSSFSKRCPGSKVPYMAASHRKQQHLAMHDQLRRAQQARFAGMLQAHKSIGQRRAGKRRALRPAKTSRASLDSFVYRYDDASTRDWEEVMGKETLRLLPQVPRERRSAVTRLQREYLTHVLSDGMVLSLPATAVQGPAAASGCQEYLFFQIVHKTTGQQKRGRSAASAAQQRMRYQASLQRMLSWTPPGGEASAGQRQLVLDGDPEVLDLFEFADWTAWSSSLQRWDQFWVSNRGLLRSGQWPARDGACRLAGQLRSCVDSPQSAG